MVISEVTGSVPTAKLGSLTVQHDNSGGTSSIVFPSRSNYNTSYGYIKYMDDLSNNAFNKNSRMVIGVESTTNDNIANKGLGYVGVNNYTPAYTLDISGNMNVSGNVYLNNSVTIANSITSNQVIETVQLPSSFSVSMVVDFNQGMVNYVTPTSNITSLSIINLPTTPLRSYAFAFIFNTSLPYYILPTTSSVNINGLSVPLAGSISISTATPFSYILQQIYLVNTSPNGVNMIAFTSANSY